MSRVSTLSPAAAHRKDLAVTGTMAPILGIYLDQISNIGRLHRRGWGGHRSASQQQYDQDDYAKPSADIGTAIVKAAIAEQDQQDNDAHYQTDDGLSLRHRNVRSILRIDEVNRDERLTTRNLEYAATIEASRCSLMNISV